MVVEIPDVFLVVFALGDDVLGHQDVFVSDLPDDGRNGGIVPEGFRHAINEHVRNATQSRDDDDIAPPPFGNQSENILYVFLAF